MKFVETSNIETVLVSVAWPTLSILIDKMKNKKVWRVEIAFKYIAWILCSYLAYSMGADMWVIAIISIASSDLVKYIASHEWWEMIKSFILKMLQK